jgi:lipoprotein-anchoring transpeptidase ErfK/SrfK
MVKYSSWCLVFGLTIAGCQPLLASDLPPLVLPAVAPVPSEPILPTVETPLPDRIPTFSSPSVEPPADPRALPLRLELKLSKRQVTLYRGEQAIKSYPVAVGRPGWETPTGTFQVLHKVEKPIWIHPLREGIVIPGGDPDNPLGSYWVGFWTDGNNWIGFHGTPTPESIGKAASHGCVRMYNQDIAELFPQLSVGTVVTVVK